MAVVPSPREPKLLELEENPPDVRKDMDENKYKHMCGLNIIVAAIIVSAVLAVVQVFLWINLVRGNPTKTLFHYVIKTFIQSHHLTAVQYVFYSWMTLCLILFLLSIIKQDHRLVWPIKIHYSVFSIIYTIFLIVSLVQLGITMVKTEEKALSLPAPPSYSGKSSKLAKQLMAQQLEEKETDIFDSARLITELAIVTIVFAIHLLFVNLILTTVVKFQCYLYQQKQHRRHNRIKE